MKNVIFVKQMGLKYSSALNLFKHEYRIVDNKNNKSFGNINWEKASWNYYMYLDDSIDSNNKKAYEDLISNFDRVIDNLKNWYEFKNWGHTRLEKNELIKLILDQNKSVNENTLDALSKLKVNKKNFNNWNCEFQDFIDKNNLSFQWNNGIKTKKNIKSFKTWINDTNINGIAKRKIVQEFQIHFSGNWFEQMGYVKFKNTNVFERNFGIKEMKKEVNEITSTDSLINWFRESILFFKELLNKTFGDKNDKFLGAQLHLDEAKPHINIQIHNVNYEGEQKLSISKSKEEFNSIYKWEEINKSFYHFYREHFDSNLEPAGWVKKYYDIKNYKSLEELKEDTIDLNLINFKDMEYLISSEQKNITSRINDLNKIKEIYSLIRQLDYEINNGKMFNNTKAQLILKIGFKQTNEIHHQMIKEIKK